MEQLAFPNLFPAPIGELARAVSREVQALEKAEHDCISWLVGTHGCGFEVVPYVHRLFREFGRGEAFDRAKVLVNICGMHHMDGWGLEDAEYIGLYDHTITDYHVLWDRGWAISMLVPRELVPKVWKCGYGGKPKFWGRDGNLLFQSIYSVDGKPLTWDERRVALAGDAE